MAFVLPCYRWVNPRPWAKHKQEDFGNASFITEPSRSSLPAKMSAYKALQGRHQRTREIDEYLSMKYIGMKNKSW